MRFSTALSTVPALAVLAFTVITPRDAFAQVIFRGADNVTTPTGARPNSNAAAASFDAAAASLGPIRQIDFESQAVTATIPAGGFNLGSGVTFTAVNTSPGSGIASGNDIITGFNTTAGGTKFLRMYSSSTTSTGTFTFTAPIQSFGAYFTGVGTTGAASTIFFDDGTSQSYLLTDQNNGGVQFFGFTDVGKSIASVSIRTSAGDYVGIDDVRTVAAVPEPGVWVTAVSLGGTTAFGMVRGRRRIRKAAS